MSTHLFETDQGKAFAGKHHLRYEQLRNQLVTELKRTGRIPGKVQQVVREILSQGRAPTGPVRAS